MRGDDFIFVFFRFLALSIFRPLDWREYIFKLADQTSWNHHNNTDTDYNNNNHWRCLIYYLSHQMSVMIILWYIMLFEYAFTIFWSIHHLNAARKQKIVKTLRLNSILLVSLNHFLSSPLRLFNFLYHT